LVSRSGLSSLTNGATPRHPSSCLRRSEHGYAGTQSPLSLLSPPRRAQSSLLRAQAAMHRRRHGHGGRLRRRTDGRERERERELAIPCAPPGCCLISSSRERESLLACLLWAERGGRVSTLEKAKGLKLGRGWEAVTNAISSSSSSPQTPPNPAAVGRLGAK
jgi:hypothetical protein